MNAPDDPNGEMLADFLQEAGEHLDTLEHGLLELENADSADEDMIDRLFRAVHSIKGAAGFLDFDDIVEVAHAAESTLGLLREKKVKTSRAIVDILLQATDDLRRILEAPGAALTARSLEIIRRLKEIREEPVSSASSGATLQTLPEFDDSETLFVLRYIMSAVEGGLPAIRHELSDLGTLLAARIREDLPWLSIPAALESGPDAAECWVAFMTPLAKEFLKEAVGVPVEEIVEIPRKQALLKDIREDLKRPVMPALQGVSPEPAPTEMPSLREATPPANPPAKAESPPPRGTTAMAAKRDEATKAGAASAHWSIRVNVGLMDTIMSLAGELVLVRNQQLSLFDQADPRLRDTIQRLDGVTNQLQESIMLTRMQPIANLFDKLPRVVRDLAHKLGKEISLELRGAEVELDKNILENLSDPLAHMIRNACDHGIEPPEARIAANKSPRGTITVSAFQEGGQIIIEISDDGKGIDSERVRQKAVARKLRTAAEIDALDEKEIVNLILLPGFSTAEEVSDISGRGVGMDVVKSAIDCLGGSIQLTSRLGQGSTVKLRLPLTLAIIPSLIVQTGPDRFAIPQVSIDELVSLKADGSRGRIEVMHDQEVFRLRERLLPLIRLDELLSRPRPFTPADRREISESHRQDRLGEEGVHIAVVKAGDEQFGLIVEAIHGTEEIVIKPMHRLLKQLQCFSGCTIMGDGRVAFILDIEGIRTHTGIQFTRLMGESPQPEMKHAHSTQHYADGEEGHDVILFRYGPREQYAIPLSMIQRIETISAEEIQKVGSREFVNRDGVSVYALRLDRVLDVSAPEEMPSSLFLMTCKYTQRPLGILVSAIVDTCETRIHFREDSYLEDGLLGSMVMHEQITLFLDLFRLMEKADPEWFGHHARNPLPLNHRRVLLVEDGDFFRQLTRRYLEDCGFEVVATENGREALQRLNQENFDIVVSDLIMPEMDGWSLAEEVRRRAQQKNMPLLALSSLQSERDRNKALQSGFDRYVTKFDREAFLHNVTELLQKALEGAEASTERRESP